MRGYVAFVLAGCAGVSACAVDAPGESTVAQDTTVCGGSATVAGIDVSAYESSIDWTAAHGAGIDFAIIRATDGTQYVDPMFDTYWQGAKDAGVIRGAYQFFRPAEDPIAQADLLLAMTDGLQPGDLPPVIDVETTGGLAPSAVATAVTAWVDHVTAAIGRPPIIYAGFYSWADDTGSLDLTSSPLWHAQYTTAPCPNIPVPWTSWLIWQHSSTGTVPGVLGEPTDLDVFNGDAAALQAFVANGVPACGTIAAAGGEIDQGSACFDAGGPAATLRTVTDAGSDGSLVWTYTTAATSEGNFAQWDLSFAEAGRYRVEVYTDTAYAQSKQARYVVAAGGGAARQDVTIDQSAVDGWQPLGDFAFAAGGGQFVHLGDDTGEAEQRLVFDALRVTRLDGDGDGSGSAFSGMPGSGSKPPAHDGDAAGCSAAGAGGAAGSGWLALVLAAITASGARTRARRRARRRSETARPAPCAARA